MNTVEDLFQELSYGPLANLAMAAEGTGTILPKDRARILSLANQGLKHLYSRFLLSEQSLMVTLQEGVTEYPLQATDLLKVQAVYTPFGVSLPLADVRNADWPSVSGSQLFVPEALTDSGTLSAGTELEVVYQAKHAPLLPPEPDVRTDAEVYAQPVVLPSVLEEALLAFIASKVYGQMNTQEALLASQMHHARYEAVCGEAVQYGLLSTGHLATPIKFELQGWV